jgi:hypothetical protein
MHNTVSCFNYGNSTPTFNLETVIFVGRDEEEFFLAFPQSMGGQFEKTIFQNGGV